MMHLHFFLNFVFLTILNQIYSKNRLKESMKLLLISKNISTSEVKTPCGGISNQIWIVLESNSEREQEPHTDI